MKYGTKFIVCIYRIFYSNSIAAIIPAGDDVFNWNTYIVPMISNRSDYASVIENLTFDKRRYFVFNKDSYASMIYYAEYHANNDSCRYIAYQDTTRAGAERQDYIKAIAMGKNGYTEEGLLENEQYFGLFLLETNDFEAGAETIFCHYKDRWSIETYYNYVRNDVGFNALYQQDYFCMQGVSSGLIKEEIYLWQGRLFQPGLLSGIPAGK